MIQAILCQLGCVGLVSKVRLGSESGLRVRVSDSVLIFSVLRKGFL